ncbi:succinylglutamate desuccinylase/aspartoacylase family protein [Euzebya tangerina]|uniref:succinylglutamate desuccinylase/aspartoacylase family protein n=1 Tax=Euzebya tangerina TaxID=591198 RepID=UPI00196AA6F5|nr:succinylglutamate desuccinylase/aspartoacylase family protein [Euzebya tangerina]
MSPARRASRPVFEIGDAVVKAGRKARTQIPITKLVSGSPISLPVLAVHGRHEGPTIWLNGAIHGDEVNGVEIIRRVLAQLDPRSLHGTVIAVPIVNVPGFLSGDRYLPDRRDLNRSFPGSSRGSLASRIAKIFMTEIVRRCTVGIDLHTGSGHRTNLPQIRANLDDPTTRALADAFGAPLMMHAATRDGSLRQAGTEAGATVLLYEGGEAWRYDETAIVAGTDGVLAVMAALDMVSEAFDRTPPTPYISRRSRWVRARRSGLMQLAVDLGDRVDKGASLGRIHDSFGGRLGQINAPADGMVIGLNLDPSVNQGDALVHIAHNEGNHA